MINWYIAKVLLLFSGEKDGLFHKWHYINWISTFERLNLELSFILYTKINSRCIIDLISKEKQEVLKENIGDNLHEIIFKIS